MDNNNKRSNSNQIEGSINNITTDQQQQQLKFSTIARRQSHPESAFLSSSTPLSSPSLTSQSTTTTTITTTPRNQSRSFNFLGGRSTTPHFQQSDEDSSSSNSTPLLVPSTPNRLVSPSSLLSSTAPNRFNSNSIISNLTPSGTNLIFPSPFSSTLPPQPPFSSSHPSSISESTSSSSGTSSPKKSNSRSPSTSTSTSRSKKSKNHSRPSLTSSSNPNTPNRPNSKIYTSFNIGGLPTTPLALDDEPNEGGWWKWSGLSNNTTRVGADTGKEGGKDEEWFDGGIGGGRERVDERSRLLDFSNSTSSKITSTSVNGNGNGSKSIYHHTTQYHQRDMEEIRGGEGGEGLRRTESEREELEREGLIHPGSREGRRLEGLPKVSRECLVSEIKCYGKHMLPPIVFFVFFVLGVIYLVLHGIHKL